MTANISRRHFTLGAAAVAASALVPNVAFADEEDGVIPVDESWEPADPRQVIVEREPQVTDPDPDFSWADNAFVLDDEGNPVDLQPQVKAAMNGVAEPTPDERDLGDPYDDILALNAPDPRSWMADLPDDRLISEVNIPGTHDSGMTHGAPLTKQFARTQYKDIDEQLELGCRLFDIRLAEPKLKSGTEKGHLLLTHGYQAFSAAKSDGAPLYFSDVMDWIRSFLEKHPSEFVLIAPRYECGNEGYYKEYIVRNLFKYREMRCTDPKHPERDFLYKAHKIPTVGEVRGCVVLLNRDSLWRDSTEWDWGIRLDMDKGGSNHVVSCDTPKGHKSDCTCGEYHKYSLRIENNYRWNHDAEDKKRASQEFIVNTTERFPMKGEPYPEGWTDIVMHYTSGYAQYTAIPIPEIAHVATYVSPFLRSYQWQKGYRYGWTLHDFVGNEKDNHEFNPMRIANTNYFTYDTPRTDRYISELGIGVADHSGDALRQLTSNGFMIAGSSIDCNCGAGGKWIFLGYKTTNDPDKAIRDILVHTDHNKSKIKLHGITYDWVGAPNDFNQGCGGSSAYIYVAYTRDKRAGAPITDIAHFVSWWGGHPGSAAVEVNGWESARYCDGDRKSKGRSGSLNYDSGARNYIFIRYKREKASKLESGSEGGGFIDFIRRLFGMS